MTHSRGKFWICAFQEVDLQLSELRKTVFEKCIHFGDTAQVLLFFVKCNERVCVNNVSLLIRSSTSGCSKCLGLSHQSVFQVGGQDEDPLGRGAEARSLAQLRLLLQLHHSRRGEWLSLSARSINVYWVGHTYARSCLQDVLFDSKAHRVKKVILHTNYPGHYDFNM